MKMTRFLCLFCAALMVLFSLAACDNQPKTPATEPQTTTAETELPTGEDTEQPTEPDTEPGTEPATEPGTEPATQPGTGSDDPTQPGVTTRSRASQTTANQNIATTAQKKTTTVALADDKVVNMNNYSFVMTSSWMKTSLTSDSTLFEQLFFKRIEEVEKDYNCRVKISSFYADYKSLSPYIRAGKKVADVMETTPYQYYSVAAAGFLKPWSAVSNIINTADARWVPGYTALGTFRDTIYGLQYMRPPEVRYCVIFNKDLIKRNGLNADALYDAVDKGTWNWSMLKDYATKCTKDTDADGVNDTWGILGEFNYFSTAIFWSNDARLVSMGADQKAVAPLAPTRPSKP